MEKLIRNPGLDHLAIEIFQYLDWGSLRRCRLVSNTWRIWVYKIIQKRCKKAKDEIAEKEYYLRQNFPEWRSVYRYFKKDKGEQELKWFMCLLSEYASRISKMDVKWTPVFYAVTIGDLEILKFLKHSPTYFCGRNWRYQKDNYDFNTSFLTPLQLACAHGKLEIIKFLLDCSFDSKEEAFLWDRPLIFFALLSNHYFDIIQLFSRYASCQYMQVIFEFNLLFENFDEEMKKFGVVNLIREHSKNILGYNYFIANGNTLLHFACMHGNSELVKDIIEHGLSDLYPLNSTGETPSDIASRNGFEDIADLIDTKMGLPDLANDDNH